ncbi:protein LEAD-SENSITIVE 1-like [Ziziphus jujuba]|uniref:Protein LEAD-SENSITIVE 1-like n=1 Tax=Ziziphus jujuba TaxID=326968 RepID=A0ABM3IH72_ZIZJJ|nr:protein LEAD-SENSITIVE 1-like [Ziziphus jujuba]
MAIVSTKIKRDQLKPGDHVFSWRELYVYAHHAIYVGDGKLIHFTVAANREIGSGTVSSNFGSTSSSRYAAFPCPICGYHSRLGGVVSTCIDCFLYGGDLYLFKYGVSMAELLANPRSATVCTLASSDPSEVVLHRAFYLLENGFGAYDLFEKNCIDFALYCKTGLIVLPGAQRSVLSLLALAVAALSTIPLGNFGFAVSVYGTYRVIRLAHDIGFRDDATKIEVEELVRRFP